MATFNEVKASIDENITDNGEGKITGGVLNGILHDMVGATEDAIKTGGGSNPELLEGFIPLRREFSDEFNNDFAR